MYIQQKVTNENKLIVFLLFTVDLHFGMGLSYVEIM